MRVIKNGKGGKKSFLSGFLVGGGLVLVVFLLLFFVLVGKVTGLSVYSVAKADNPGEMVVDALISVYGIVVEEGKVGIGVKEPQEKLEVAGNIRLGGDRPTYRVMNVADPERSGDASSRAYVDRRVVEVMNAFIQSVGQDGVHVDDLMLEALDPGALSRSCYIPRSGYDTSEPGSLPVDGNFRKVKDLKIDIDAKGDRPVLIVAKLETTIDPMLCTTMREYFLRTGQENLTGWEQYIADWQYYFTDRREELITIKRDTYIEAYIARDGKIATRVTDTYDKSGNNTLVAMDYPPYGEHEYTLVVRAFHENADGCLDTKRAAAAQIRAVDMRASEF